MAELTREEKKERVRRRIRAATDPGSYSYTPEKENQDHVKIDEFQLVAIYARVSTEDPAQTSSFELQQKYYVDLVARHPKWKLVKIYADEGKSGTTTAHREAFREMLADAYAGKINLIIVKNISRFARNVLDFLTTIRKLTEKRVGVLFESEGIYSLNDVNHMTLSFHATIAEEESRIRSRSMETSLRMRLDHGLPLTPELLGFIKGADGKLVKNPETWRIPKLMFSMYLYGYSTEQIASTLTKLSKRTYLGNLKWSAGGVATTLRNERYCGDVLTRKRFRVFAPDVDEQKSFKNRGEKPQSYYRREHEQIISYDDFVAVQRIMDNARFGGTSLLPELLVIPEGFLKGYVIIHPKWGSFTAEDYRKASLSVDDEKPVEEIRIEAEAGTLDLRGYEVAATQLFSDGQIPSISLQQSEVKFGIQGIRDLTKENFVELLIHPGKKKLAVRPASADNRYAGLLKEAPEQEMISAAQDNGSVSESETADASSATMERTPSGAGDMVSAEQDGGRSVMQNPAGKPDVQMLEEKSDIQEDVLEAGVTETSGVQNENINADRETRVSGTSTYPQEGPAT